MKCWYSILRNGLRNMSSSSYQLNGRALGSGIYLSESNEYSFDYCQAGPPFGELQVLINDL